MKGTNLGNRWKARWYKFQANYRVVILAGCIAASGVLGLRAIGGLQLLELRVFDWLIVLRPLEDKDPRLVIVGITDEDLDNYVGTASISDQTVAKLLRRIKTQEPRVIGLDFYRNLPSQPGTEELAKVFAETPNLIGIEKVIGANQSAPIPGNRILTENGQVAASDIVVDSDGRVRRGILVPSADDKRVLEGLGLRIALDYLAKELPPITPQQNSSILTIDGIAFSPVEAYTGGYLHADAQGYQLLLNLRQRSEAFTVVSLGDILCNEYRENNCDPIPTNLMRDRIVLVGSMALSDADIFYTTHRRNQSQVKFGVELHGEITSQIISAVLDSRPLIHTWPTWLEGLLILALAIGGSSLAKYSSSKLWQRIVLIPGTSLLVVGLSYGALSYTGLWLPVVPILLGLWSAVGLMGIHRTSQLQILSAKDKLTGLANRRTFDEHLQHAWFKALRSQRPLTLIIGDVDHFKKYNDTYGHPQGDDCLKRVAQAIRTTARSHGGLSARYGGEEFVVLLPNTSPEEGVAIAEAILAKLISYKLPHAASDTADHVTMSMGITSFTPQLEIPASALVEMADLGLYTAKKSGRNRVMSHQPDTLDHLASQSSESKQPEPH